MTTMLVIGLWHGVTANFVIWGAWHGLGLFIHNRWSSFAGSKVNAPDGGKARSGHDLPDQRNAIHIRVCQPGLDLVRPADNKGRPDGIR